MALTSRWVTLREMMEYLGTDPELIQEWKFQITPTIAGQTITVNLIDHADIQRDWLYIHGNRVFLDLYYKEESEDIAVATARLKLLWNVWKLRRASAYTRMYEALAEEALTNPTENYDRMEEGGWQDEVSLGEKVRTTDTTPAVVNTSEQYIAGDDSDTPVLASKNVVTPGGQTDSTTTTDEEATDTTTRTYQEYRVHGNIGVSTAADMAEKILALHAGADLTQQALNEFVDLYTIYR